MKLTATSRTLTGRRVKNLRQAGLLPAVVYGHGFANQNLSLDYAEFLKVLSAAGESTLVELELPDQQTRRVLIQEVERDPVTDQVIHVDLRQVRLDEKIEADIPLLLEGTAPAVKELGGILVAALSAIKVKALPQDLVHEIKVDVTNLRHFGDMIRISDLPLPETLEILNKMDTVVAIIEEPRAEEVIEPTTPEEAEKAAIEAQAKEAGEPKAEGEAGEAAAGQAGDKGKAGDKSKKEEKKEGKK